MRSIHLWLFIGLTLISSPSFSQEKNDAVHVYYDQATYFESGNHFKMKSEIRLQFRASTPFENNPTNIADLKKANTTNLEVSRARLKFEGFAYKPELHYKVEYDFNNSTLLDGRLTYWFHESIGIRLGRYKVNFNPERVRSSKDLQVADRSIVNQYFTLDRQQGVSLMGRVAKDTAFDSSYSLEVFNGNGREAPNTDKHLLTVLRYQWNALGGKIETAMGDLTFRQKPAFNMAFSAAHNISPYTAFSSSGGTQLPGYTAGTNSEYEVQQWMLDIKYKYNGFSFISEYHEKLITESQINTRNKVSGFLVNTGVFPHVLLESFPDNIELAFRYAHVDASELNKHTMEEFTLAANLFFNGHRNKITADAGSYTVKDNLSATEWRYRLQWDISF